MASELTPPKRPLEAFVDEMESYRPECLLYVKKGLKKVTLRTPCFAFSPTDWSPKKAAAYARKNDLSKLMSLADLEDLIIDLSLKKTHFNSADFLEALSYYLKKGKFMPVAQPY